MAPNFDPEYDEVDGRCSFCNKQRRVQPCFRCRKARYCSKHCRLRDLPRQRKRCRVIDHAKGDRSSQIRDDTPPRPESNHLSPSRALHARQPTTPAANSRHPRPHTPTIVPTSISRPHTPKPHPWKVPPKTPPRTQPAMTHLFPQPFHALASHTWLHNRPLQDITLLLHDAYQHRAHLNALHHGSDHAILQAPPSDEAALLARWVSLAEIHGLLPTHAADGTRVTARALVAQVLALTVAAQHDIGDENNALAAATAPAWDDAGVAARHGDEWMGLQMRAFGEQVIGCAAGAAGHGHVHGQGQGQIGSAVLAEGVWRDLLKWEEWEAKEPRFEWRVVFEGS